MSLSALLQAVQNELREEVSSLDSKNCAIRGGDGQPPAKFGGRTFAAVVPTGWSLGTSGVDGFSTGLDEIYNVDIIISYRTGQIPEDLLMGKAFLDASKGLEPLVRSIMVVMRNNRYIGILRRANAITTATNELIEPLRWLGNDPQPQPVGPDWFSGEGQDARAYGWRFGLHYGDARRPQSESNLQ